MYGPVFNKEFMFEVLKLQRGIQAVSVSSLYYYTYVTLGYFNSLYK